MKRVYNSILLNRKPYFFKYLYKTTRKEEKKYNETQDFQCRRRFGKNLEEMLSSKFLSHEEEDFIKRYYEWHPLIVSNSCMNLLCYYIESINFNLNQKIKSSENFQEYYLYKNNKISYDMKTQKKIIKTLLDYKEQLSIFCELKIELNTLLGNSIDGEEGYDNILFFDLKEKLLEVCNSVDIIVNVLVDYFYRDNPKINKDMLWKFFDKEIFNNIKTNTTEKIYYPFKDENGEIEYLGSNYSIREVDYIG